MRRMIKNVIAGVLAVAILCSNFNVVGAHAAGCGDPHCGEDGTGCGTHVYKWCSWDNSKYGWIGLNGKVLIHEKESNAKDYITSSNKSVISVKGLSWEAKSAGKATLSLKQKRNGKVKTIEKQSFTIKTGEFWNTRSSKSVKETDLKEYADCIGTIRPNETKSFYFENSNTTNVTPKLVGDSKNYATVKKCSVTDRYAFTLKAGSSSDGKTLTISLGNEEVKVFVIPSLCIAPGEKFPFLIAVTYEEFLSENRDVEDDWMLNDLDLYAVGLVDETYFSLGNSRLCTPRSYEFEINGAYGGEFIYSYYLQASKNTPEGYHEVWTTYKGVKTKKAVKEYRHVWVTKDADKLNKFNPAPGYDFFVE